MNVDTAFTSRTIEFTSPHDLNSLLAMVKLLVQDNEQPINFANARGRNNQEMLLKFLLEWVQDPEEYDIVKGGQLSLEQQDEEAFMAARKSSHNILCKFMVALKAELVRQQSSLAEAAVQMKALQREKGIVRSPFAEQSEQLAEQKELLVEQKAKPYYGFFERILDKHKINGNDLSNSNKRVDSPSSMEVEAKFQQQAVVQASQTWEHKQKVFLTLKQILLDRLKDPYEVYVAEQIARENIELKEQVAQTKKVVLLYEVGQSDEQSQENQRLLTVFLEQYDGTGRRYTNTTGVKKLDTRDANLHHLYEVLPIRAKSEHGTNEEYTNMRNILDGSRVRLNEERKVFRHVHTVINKQIAVYWNFVYRNGAE